MNAIDSIKMDKSVFSVGSLTDESDEKEFWLSKTPEERLEAMELLRQLNYGYDPASARLQRIFTVTALKEI